MEPQLYTWMAQVEDRHWWFASRRAIVEHLHRAPGPCPRRRYSRTRMWHRRQLSRCSPATAAFTQWIPKTIRSFRHRHAESPRSMRGTLPDQLPFGGLAFDLILMTDVLEHLDDDAAALKALRARLKPGGWLLMTVPAMPWLWSGHDLAHHHRRRYCAADLRPIAQAAGLDVLYLGYFNFILFPAVAAVRLAQRLRPRDQNGAASAYTTMPPRFVNALLTRVFSSERRLLDVIRAPFGVSLLMLARPSATFSAITTAADRAY